MKRRSLTAKMLRLLCVGYVVLFNGWLALSFAGMSLESFHPRYQVSQVASGIKFAALGLALLSIGLGVAFGYRWARWVSIALGALGLCLSVFILGWVLEDQIGVQRRRKLRSIYGSRFLYDLCPCGGSYVSARSEGLL